MRISMKGQLWTSFVKQPTSVFCWKKSSILKYAVQIVVVILLFTGMCGAQTQFAFAVGGVGEEKGNSVAPTFDGGYIVTGGISGFGVGGDDIFLGKFDSSGVLTWAKTVGGAGHDWGYSVAQTSDGGYIVTGATMSFGAGTDIFLVKFNSTSSIEWAKAIGGTGEDCSYSVAQTFDRGYIVTGYTKSFGAGREDLFLVKFNSFGVLTWAKTVGRTCNDCGYSVAQTSDRGYIVTGRTVGYGMCNPWDLFLVKFNSSGDLTWAKTVGGASHDLGFSVALTSDGGYIVTGETRSFGAGGCDLFLIKFNSSDDLTWAKTVGGSGGAYGDEGRSVAPTSDGGYIVTGGTDSFGAGSSDLFLCKFNSSGDLAWAKTIGGSFYELGFSVDQTKDGGYIVTGETWSFGAGFSDLFLGKFNSSGDLTWARTVGGADWDGGGSVTQTFDRRYIVTGSTMSFGAGNDDLFLGKFSSSGEIGDCPYVADCSPVVGSCSLSSVSASPTITILSLSAVSCSPAVTSPSPTVTKICPSFISEEFSKPISFELTVSPNPFNSSCAIMICQHGASAPCAKVEIYDLQGRLVWNKPSDSDYIGVTSLIKGGKPEEVPLNKGDVAKRQGVSASTQGVIIWQPEKHISSGVYLVRATTDVGQQITKRIVYLK